MADYKHVRGFPDRIIRTLDNATIPEGHRFWDEYQAWLAAGNTPDPAETPTEVAARQEAEQEAAGQETLRADLKMDAVFTALKTATPAQISTFVNNQFGAFTAQQRATMRMLIQVAALVIRRM